jgi:preprotein translocase subunit SecB
VFIENNEILFEKFFIDNIAIKPNHEYHSKKEKDILEDDYYIDWSIFKHKDNNQFILTFILKINEKKEHFEQRLYQINLESTCFFKVSEEIEEEKVKQYMSTHAILLVLGTIRGYLTTITASMPYGEFLLPSLDVRELFAIKSNNDSKDSSEE